MSKLTVLSYGAGQDSTAILYKMIYDREFRNKYVPEDLIVVMAETGNEHPETEDHVEFTRGLCKTNNIPFYHLGYNYTPDGWKGGLIKFYERTSTVGSKAFPKTCTDKLKIQAIYSFLEQYVHKTYKTVAFGRKRALKEFANKYGKIDVLIGIAAGEEKRIAVDGSSPNKWMNLAIRRIYPLVDLGMDRGACQKYMSMIGMPIPIPSNCILCPFMSKQELLYLSLAYPEWYLKWVDLEQTKIDANKHMGAKNLGVWGKKLLPEILKEAQEKFADMSFEDLKEYKMSHGHCVMSKY